MSYLRGEVSKLWTLPSAWIAAALIVVLPPVLAAVNGNFLRRSLESGRTGGLLTTSTVDEGFGQLVFGLIGVVVLGVVAVSTEYSRNARTVGSGRQVSTTMVAAPKRIRLVAMKLLALSLAVTLLAVVSVPLTLWASHWALGHLAPALGLDALQRGLWAGAYWVGTGLLAFTLAAVTRNGVVPLVLLVTNSSMVSFSLLAAQVSDWAKFLPDLAAYPTFLIAHPMKDPLSPKIGAAVFGGWCIGAVVIAVVNYTRRDA